MREIPLPVSPLERFAGPTLVIGLTLATAVAPVAPPWQWITGLLVLTLGLAQQQRYLARRPKAATLSTAGGVVLHHADGQVFAVARVRIGCVGPGLLAARCVNATGRVVNLVIPGACLPADEHRRLRSALLALEDASRPEKRDL